MILKKRSTHKQIIIRVVLLNITIKEVEPFDRSIRYRGPPFFTFSVNNSFSMKKMKKFLHSYPILFSILHMCANFHHDRTINKNVLFEGYGPFIPKYRFSVLCGAVATLKKMGFFGTFFCAFVPTK